MFRYKVVSTLQFILLTTTVATTTRNNEFLHDGSLAPIIVAAEEIILGRNLQHSAGHMPPRISNRRTRRQVADPGGGPCGYSNFGDGDAQRIINDGTVAEFLEFPWMVALRRNQNVTWSQKAFLLAYLGGGSLIHPRVVLTAAHKVDGLAESTIKVRAGDYDIESEMEIYPYQERAVKKIISHEYYYRKSVLNSIALLILESPFTLAPNIGLACLGTVLPPAETRCWGMGWGKTGTGNDTYSTVLKKVELPLKSREDCTTALQRVRNRKHFQLHPSLTCAGGEEGKDTCGGDGGSPLVCSIGDPKELRYAVYGMVAYGHRCGDVKVPGVYVNVPEFSSWIEDKLNAEGLATGSYKF